MTLGLTKLYRSQISPGTALEAMVEGLPVAAEVVRHPVYERERKRAKDLA
jgi:hypothetical protein